MITAEMLTTEKTFDVALAEVLTIMEGAKFRVTAWESGSLGLAFATVLAELWVRIYNAAVNPAARSVYSETATGVALTQLSKAHFDNERLASVATQGSFTLTAAASSGPHTITNQHVFSTDSEITFRAVGFPGGPTLSAGGTLTVTIECETPGDVGNVDNGAITQLQTPIAGVTGTNGIAGGDDWIAITGVNEESDAVLHQRNATKFPTLSPNSPTAVYRNLALSAVDNAGTPVGVTRVSVDASNPGGPNTIWMYVANATATATAEQVATIQSYVASRLTPGAILTVYPATEVVVDINAYSTIRRGFGEVAIGEVDGALRGYINGLEIGGFRWTALPSSPGALLQAELYSAAMAVEQVLNFDLSAPGGDLSLALSEVAIPGVLTLPYGEL